MERLKPLELVKIFFVLASIWFFAQSPSLAEDFTQTPIKVMTLNLHNGRDSDNRPNFARLAELIAAEQPDIIALQEVQPNYLKHLQISGYQSIAGPNANLPFFRFGNVLLTRHPIIYHRHHYLPSQKEQRGVDEVAIKINGQYLRILNTHIGLGSKDQKQQIDEISRISRYLTGPLLITGDFNLEPSNRLLADFNFKEAGSGLADYKTFPTKQPKFQIDQVWYNGYFQPAEARTIDWQGSDHLPVVATMKLKTAASLPLEKVAIPDPTLRHNPLLPDAGDHPLEADLTVGLDNSSFAGSIEMPYKNCFLISAGYNGSNPELAITYLKTIDLRDYDSLGGMRGKAEWDFRAATDLSGHTWLEWRQYYRWSDSWGSKAVLATNDQSPSWSWEQYFLPTESLRLMVGVNADSEFTAGVAIALDKRQVIQVKYVNDKAGAQYGFNWEYQF